MENSVPQRMQRLMPNLPKLCPKDCSHTSPQCMSDLCRHVPDASSVLMLHLPTKAICAIGGDTRNGKLFGGSPFDSFAANCRHVCVGGLEPQNVKQLWAIGEGAVLASLRHDLRLCGIA